MEEPRLHPHLTKAGVECPPPGARLLSSPQTHLCCVVLCCLSSDLKIFLSSSSPTSTPQAPSPPPPCLDRKIHRRLLFLFSSQLSTNQILLPDCALDAGDDFCAMLCTSVLAPLV